MDIRERSDRFGKNLERHPWELARLEVIHKLIQDFAAEIYDGGSIVLDIGCGDAFVTQKLAARYPKTRFVGVDQALDSRMMQRSRANAVVPNLDIYQSVGRIPFDNESVGIVLFLDVLEHVRDDVLFFESILHGRLIKKNALFLVIVPAYQCLFCARDIFLNHFRRYNSTQLLRVIYKAQAKPIQYGYFFSSLLIPRLLQSICEKTHIIRPKLGTSVSKWKGHGFLDLLMKQVLIYDVNVSRLFRKFHFLLPGLSCYVIGRK